MTNGTDKPPEQHSPPLQPNQILAVPATVQACRADYDAAADVRQTMAQQEARRS